MVHRSVAFGEQCRLISKLCIRVHLSYNSHQDWFQFHSDMYVGVEKDGDMIVVNCAELETRKCMLHIENAFDGREVF